MWLVDISNKINIITSSKYYESDFGDKVNENKLPSDLKNIEHLGDYFIFLKKIGYGELDACFFVEDYPIESKVIYGKDKSHLSSLLIFATDQSEYSFAFDSENDFCVVEIDASGDISETVLGTFLEFITQKIDSLVDIVKWREVDF